MATDYTALASCMGAWLMEDNGSTETDQSGNSCTLTVSSSDTIERLNASLPTNFTGYYRHFEKSDEDWMYRSDGGYTDINGASAVMSFFIRFRLESETGTIQRFLFKNLQYSCFLNSNGTVSFLLYNNSGTFVNATGVTDVGVNTGVWQTVGCVYDGTDLRVYVNGSLDSGANNPKSQSGGIQNGSGQFFIGCDDSTDQSFDGDIYEVGIWNDDLSASDILSMHNYGITGDQGSVDDELTGQDISSGTPTIDTPAIGQIHSLFSNDLTSGTTVIDTPAIGQIHALLSQDISSGTPTLDTPIVSENNNPLTGQDITSGTPVIDTPAIGQIHVLSGQEITAGIPTIYEPTLANGLDELTGQDITSGTPVVDTPTIGQINAIISSEIAAGTPTIDTPAIGQIHSLSTPGITTAYPTFNEPYLNYNICPKRVCVMSAQSRVCAMSAQSRVCAMSAQSRVYTPRLETRYYMAA